MATFFLSVSEARGARIDFFFKVFFLFFGLLCFFFFVSGLDISVQVRGFS